MNIVLRRPQRAAAPALFALAILTVPSLLAQSPLISSVANLITPRTGHTATLLSDGTILVIGGEDRGVSIFESEIFDPGSVRFLPAAQLHLARTDHSAIRLADGRVLVTGGRFGANPLDSTEIYEPAKASFSAGPFMTRPRYGHTATLLNDGRVLILGGENTGTAEVYDPAANTFVPVESLSLPRSFHSATLLPNGNVLITGGVGLDAAPLVRAEMLNLDTMHFANVMSPMSAGRMRPLLNVLPDGNVQIIGGDTGNTIEIFDPAGAKFQDPVRLAQSPDSFFAILGTPGRTALFGTAVMRDPQLARIVSEPLFKLLLDRRGHSLTELPQSNKVLVAGGVSGSSAKNEASNSAMIIDLSPAPAEKTPPITGKGPSPAYGKTASASNGGFTDAVRSSAGGGVSVFSGTANLAIVLGSQETLWLDANKCNAQGPRAAYISFIIQNTGTADATNVTATFAGFTGTASGLVQPSYFSAPSDLTRTFSTIAAGAQEPIYFYVDYSTVCLHSLGGGNPYTGYTANYSLTVNATGLSAVVRNGTVTTGDLLTASAAGQATATQIGAGFWVGQVLTQTVTFSFGNNTDLFFQPLGDAAFDAACIRLSGSEITGVTGTVPTSLIGLKDQLWFPTASSPGGGGDILLTFTWNIVCTNTQQTLHPWAAAKSGQKYKYTGFSATSIYPPSVTAVTASKSVSPTSMANNTLGPATWTVTFTNVATVPIVLSKITDILPSCMSMNNPAATGSGVTSTNSFTLPSAGATGTVSWVGYDHGKSSSTTYQVPASSTLALKYTTNVSSCSYPASYTNSATGTVGTTTVGPVTATLGIGSTADLSVTKTDGSSTYAPGSNVVYTVVVSNAGPSTATGATVSDPLPSGITTSNFTATASGGATGFTASGSGAISDTVNMPSGSSITYTVTMAVPSGRTGNLVNTATVTAPSGLTDPTPGNNSATDTDTQASSADLSVTKTDGSSTYAPGSNVVYTVVVSNAGPSNVTGATVSDALPTGITTSNFTATASGGATGFTASGSGAISDTVNMPSGSSITYTVTMAVPAGRTGNLANTATVTAPGGVTDPTPGNNSATDTDTQASSADLSVTKTDGSSTYTPGNNVVYTVVVSNAGPSNVTGATVSDPLPTGITTSNFTATASGGATGFTATGSGAISDTVNMPSGSSITYIVTMAVPAGRTGNLANTATVTAPGGVTDPTPGNNSATDTDTQASSADLSVTKTDGSSTYAPGSNVVYTVVVSNAGPSNVTGATVSDALPTGITTSSWTATASGGATGFSATGSGTISDTVNMPVGSSITYIVTMTVPASRTGNLANTATVTAPGGVTDPTPGNNSATDTDTQASSADLSVTKTDGSSTYTPGNNVVYTVVVSNAGPSNVTGATVSDALPTGITTSNFTATASGGATGFTASGSGAISDTVNMPSGSSITYIVTMAVPAGRTGNLVNTAIVTAPGGVTDPTPGNNSATDTDTQASSADLSATKTDGASTYTPGNNVVYTVVVSNAGPSNVTGATVSDPLPTGITTSNWTATASGGATGFSATGSGAISDTVNMPVGSSITYTVTMTIPASRTGNLVNTATVTAPGGVTDPTPGNNSATDTDTQASSADLSVTKTDGSSTYAPGSNVVYTVVVSNAGPSNVTGATVSDALPTGITTSSWTATATGGATGFSATGSGAISDTVNMPSGSSITYIVTMAVPAGRTGNLANTATVTAPGGVTDPTPGNNSATDTDTQASSADLSVTKTDGSSTYTPGNNVVYTVVVSNAGPSNVTGASVSDSLPTGITTSSWTATAAGGATGFSATGSGAISDTVNMPVGSSITYIVTMAVPAGRTGNLVNTATVAAPGGVTDPTPGNNSATDTDTQASSADLSVTKTDGSSTYTPGNNVVYTVVVSNAGPSNVTGASVSDALPSGITTSTFTATAGGGANGFTANGSGAIADTVNMPAGSSITYIVTMTVPAGRTGNLANTATVTAPGGVTDPTPGNNSATDTDTQSSSADLSVTKTDGSSTYTPGNNVVYTVVVSNAGPSNVTGATVSDALPTGITTSTFTATASGGAIGFSASGSGAISDTVNMPVGSSITYIVTMAVPAGRSGNLVNTATVTAPGGVTDPTPGNNTATDTDTQSSSADLSVTKTDGASFYTPGNNVVYTVVVSNAGPSNVTGATVSDPLPTGITTANWTATASGGATGFSASGSGAISDTVNMPSGSSITYIVTMAVPAGRTGSLVNTATVTAPGGVTDPTPGNNTATDTDTQASADLSVTKTDGLSTYTPGSNVVYTVVVSNAGPSSVTGAAVSDALPTGITTATWTATASGGATGFSASGSGAISDSVNMPVGSSITYTVTMTVPANRTGDLVNTATVTAPAGVTDPTPGNNSATDTDTQSSSADLSITKTDGLSAYIPGNNVVYTVGVSNAGPSNVTGATVSDPLPTGITTASWTATASGGATGFSTTGSGAISDTVNMPVGSSITYIVTMAVPAGRTGNLVNTATVTAPGGVTDPTPGNNSATDTDTQASSADLSVTKTDGSATYVPGNNVVYTVVVSNAGPSNVTGATVSDALPTGITTATWTATASGGANGFSTSGNGAISDTVNMPTGSSITYVVTMAIPAGRTGNLVNTATVTAPGGVTDPTPGNNTATDTDTQSSNADLSVTKTDGSATYVPGNNVVYTVVASNAGPSGVSGATVSDALPTGITTATWTATAAGGANGFTASGSGAISDTVNMPAGSSITYIVTMAVPAGRTGNLANTATVTAPVGVTDPAPGNNSATDTDTQSSSADLSITKTDGASTYIPGNNVVYTVVVSNAGPSSVTGATVSDPLPSGITTATWTATASGGANGFTANGSGAIADTVNMPSGSTITYTVTMTVPASRTGSLVNTATVTAPVGVTDPTPGNNSATDTDTQSSSADLSVTKTDGATTYVPGSNVVYTVVVSNAGPSNVTGATVSDPLPSGITTATWTAAASGGATGFTANGSGAISDTVNMPVGSSITYTVTMSVPASRTGNLVNTATVTAPVGVTDPTPGNNSATDTDTQTSSADLSVTKTDGPSTYTPGNNVVYTVVVSNAGPSNVTGATVSDPLPTGITTATWTATASGGATGFSSSGNGAISDTVNMPVGSSITYTVTMPVPASRTGNLVNTATVTAPAGVTDPTPGNNTASDTDTQSSSADLSVTKTDGASAYIPGNNVVYTVVVSNAGPSNVTGATVSDPLPSGITTATWTATASGGATGFTANGSGAISNTVNMPAGSSITYTVTMSVPASRTGNLVNTATVTVPAGVTDPTPGNNSATDTDTQVIPADLSVSKTDGSVTYTPGTDIPYTITVTNQGPGINAGFTVTDVLPGGTTFVSAPGCSYASGSVTCTSAGLAINGQASWTVTIHVDPSRTGCLTNTASITANNTPDPVAGNNASGDTDNPLGGTPQSAGLGLSLGYPAIAGNNTSHTATTYDSASKLFKLDSTPATIRFSSADTSHLFSGTVALSVRAMVGNTGVLTAGITGNDLILTGTVTDQSGQTYSGTLITAEVVQFGFRELGSTDRFELRFVVTGGTMAAKFAGQDLGIVITAESSTFNNSFGVNSAAAGKFTMGSLAQYCSIN